MVEENSSLLQIISEPDPVNIPYNVVKITSGSRSGSYFVVPHNWIFTSTEPVAGLNLVKFIQESNNPEDQLLLDAMIERKSPAPEDWEFHCCDILYTTASLLEAYKELKKLESSETVHEKIIPTNKRKSKKTTKTNDMNIAKRAALLDKSNELLIKLCQPPANNDLESVAAMQIVDVFDGSKHSSGSITSVHEDENKENSDVPTVSDGFVGQTAQTSSVLQSNVNVSQSSSSVDVINHHQSDASIIQDLHHILENVKDLNRSMDSFKNELRPLTKKVETVETSLKGLRTNIVDLARDVDELKTFVLEKRQLKENTNIITFNKLKNIHQLVLPLQEIDDFLEFERKLTDPNSQLQTDLKTHFFSTINTTVTKLDKALSPMLKNFLTQRVIKKMVAIKSMPGKIVFCETIFGKTLKECFVNAFANPEIAGEKEFESAVSIVFNNARDWGGRKTRDGPKEDERSAE